MKSKELLYSIMIVLSVFWFGATNTAFASDPSIYQIQSKLQELGYDPGTVDGLWGEKTKTALIQYQENTKLELTGEPDEPTRKSLGVKIAPRAIDKTSTINFKGISIQNPLVSNNIGAIDRMIGPDGRMVRLF